jgi:hypothetical protein
MKFARWPLIILILVLGVGGLLVALALVPGIQRWAVMRAARDVQGLRLEVGTVRAGFSGVELRDVRVERSRIIVTAARADADFSLLALVFDRRLQVTRLEATGIEIDATRVDRSEAGAAAAGAPAAAPGLLARAQLPFDLSLDNLRIEGGGKLAGEPGLPPYVVRFLITGGGVASGREGLIQIEATAEDPAPGVQVTALKVQSGLRATLSPKRTFTKVSLTTVVDATGPALSESSQLKLGAELYQTSAGENHAVTVDTVLHGERETIARIQAQLPTGARQYDGEWELKVRTAQVAPFVLGGALPEFDLQGGGRFTFEPTGTAFNVQGRLAGRATQLEAVNPAWRGIGPVQLEANFDGGRRDGILQLAQFKMALAGAQPVLEAETTAPVRFDLRQRQLATDGAAGGSLVRVNLRGLPMAWIQPFVPAFDLSGDPITGELELTPLAGSAATARILLRMQSNALTLTRDGRPLLNRAAIALRSEGTWADGVVDASAVEASVKTQDGDALRLAGRLNAQVGAQPSVAFSGNISATAAKLLARWLPGAPVVAEGEVDVALKGNLLETRPGRLQVRQAGTTLADVRIAQSFVTDLTSHELKPSEPSKQLAHIVVGRLPLELLPLAGSGGKFGGWVERGEFDVAVNGGKTTLRALGPLRLAGVSFTQNRRPKLADLTVEASPVLEYAGPTAFRLQTGDVKIRPAERSELLTFKAEMIAAPDTATQATATFTLNAAQLGSQPLFAGAEALSAGQATGEIRAVLGERKQVEARMTLNGLMLADGGRTLPVANAGFRGVVLPNGAVSVQLPVLLDNAGRRSDINVALELLPLARGYSVDGRITGQQVEWQDAQDVLGIFIAAAASGESEEAPATPASVPPDTEAAWSRFSGQVVLDLKSVTRGQDWAMTGMGGTLAIEPTRLSLPALAASFGGTSRLAARSELRFTGGPMPYRLTGDYQLVDFDVGRLFAAFEPGRPPTLDGLFSVQGDFAGNGETMMRSLERAQGAFQLTGRQGAFRGLQRASSKISMASKAVELGASMLGTILGSEKAAKTAEKVAGAAYFVDQLTPVIAELKYDLFSVKLSRDELLNMTLEEFSLVSQEVRLIGGGEVAYVAERSLLDQPLTATLTLAVRGRMEEQLGKLKALDGTKDELGYARVKDTITLGGTLARPDATAWFAKLAAEKLSEALSE